MEPRFGHDFGKVRVHADQQAGESAQALDARAYTVGPDVVFAPGQYAPGSPSTNALLAHELAHVVQQSAAPADDRSLAIGSPADAEEREAHAVQDAYLAGGPMPKLSAARPAIQRQPAPPSGKRPNTITDPEALIRTDPPDLKPTRASIPVGTHVDVVDTKITPKGTFVNVVEHGTGKVFGWTAQSNLGYAKAGARLRLRGQGEARSGTHRYAAGHGVPLTDLRRHHGGYCRVFSRRRRRLLGRHRQQLQPRESGHRHGSQDGHEGLQSDHHRAPGQRAGGRHEVAVEHAGRRRLREHRADRVDQSQDRSRPQEPRSRGERSLLRVTAVGARRSDKPRRISIRPAAASPTSRWSRRGMAAARAMAGCSPSRSCWPGTGCSRAGRAR